MCHFRENGQKTQFLTLNPPQLLDKDFFKIPAMSLFFTLLTPNFMQSFRKNEWAVSEIFKDGRTNWQTDWQGRLLRTPSGKPWVQNFWKKNSSQKLQNIGALNSNYLFHIYDNSIHFGGISFSTFWEIIFFSKTLYFCDHLNIETFTEGGGFLSKHLGNPLLSTGRSDPLIS